MKFTTYESGAEQTSIFDVIANLVEERIFDATRYRPMDITVQVTLNNIQAHLVKVGVSDPFSQC